MRQSLLAGAGLVCAGLVMCGCTSDASTPAERSHDQPQPKVQRAPVEPPSRRARPTSSPTTSKPATSRQAPARIGTPARVSRIIDGDTIQLASGRRVRLVQVDTPEVYGRAECGGAQASAALKARLTPGSIVGITRDPRIEAQDRYGRLLAYVWDGRVNINLWLVRNGHATPYFYRGVRGRYADELERSARQAQAAKRGLWKHCPNAILDARRAISTGPADPRGSAAVDDAAAGSAHLRQSGQIRYEPGKLPLVLDVGPDLNCSDLPGPVRVSARDRHRLDRDGDGIGCQ